MRALVTAASKHGATEEIAQRIGEVLAGEGIDVTVSAAGQARDLSSFQAVVLGSAVYAGHWMKEAKDLADRLAGQQPAQVWLFSSGPVGDPPKPEEDPVDVADIADRLSAVEHRLLAGRLDKSRLGFGERAIVTALRAPEGDFRDWDEISVWAREIATHLAESRA